MSYVKPAAVKGAGCGIAARRVAGYLGSQARDERNLHWKSGPFPLFVADMAALVGEKPFGTNLESFPVRTMR